MGGGKKGLGEDRKGENGPQGGENGGGEGAAYKRESEMAFFLEGATKIDKPRIRKQKG